MARKSRRRKRGKGKKKQLLKSWFKKQVGLIKKEMESIVLRQYLTLIGKTIRTDRLCLASNGKMDSVILLENPVLVMITQTPNSELMVWNEDWLRTQVRIKPLVPIALDDIDKNRLYMKLSDYCQDGSMKEFTPSKK